MLPQAAKLLAAGHPAEAIPLLIQAARANPANPAIHHDLGLACLETDRLPEAITALRHATTLNPRYTDAHFRLGIALEKHNDIPAAIRAYDRATELLPAHTEAWFRAGALVFNLGHRAEAILCFRRAAASGPKTSFGRLGAARARLAEDRATKESDAEAEKILRQTLALDRANPLAHDLLANLLADSGRFDEARDHFARAIEASPLMAGSYYDLVRCRRLTPADADLPPRIQAALTTPGLPPPQRVRLHLALGKAADDLADPATAMHHFDAAHAERTRLSPFDPAAFDAEIDRLIAHFPAETIPHPSQATQDGTPILIVGLPRSGTTLVEQIISSHPDVTPAGELDFWNARAPAAPHPPLLAQAAADYLALLRTIGPTAARITDKMPFNFLWLGHIHPAFPNATIVHCRRAPIDTALSIHQTHFNPSLAFPTGGPELVAYINAYHRLMAHWRQVLPATRFLDIDYERLAQTPEPEIRRLIAFCGLPWAESCLHPERNTRAIRTASKWQARQPINPHAIARWRAYEPWLGPLAALLNPTYG